MFGKKDKNAKPSGPLLTIAGESARLEGKFTISDSILIECEVAGEIHVDGQLVIGESGVVHADVHTSDALIKGRYEGNMVATGNVQITETGRVNGNIETDSLVISKGGSFNGNVKKMQRVVETISEHRHVGPSLVDSKSIVRRPAS